MVEPCSSHFWPGTVICLGFLRDLLIPCQKQATLNGICHKCRLIPKKTAAAAAAAARPDPSGASVERFERVRQAGPRAMRLRLFPAKESRSRKVSFEARKGTASCPFRFDLPRSVASASGRFGARRFFRRGSSFFFSGFGGLSRGSAVGVEAVYGTGAGSGKGPHPKNWKKKRQEAK